jgi:hypothetical protein
MMIAEFTSEPVYAFDRPMHQPLSAGNLIPEATGVDRSLFFQRQQSDVDSQQSLRDFILEIAADLLAFVLLRRENLVGQVPQMFLQCQ